MGLLFCSISRKAGRYDKPRPAFLGEHEIVCPGYDRLLSVFVRCVGSEGARRFASCLRVSRSRTMIAWHEMFPDLTAYRVCIERSRNQHNDPDKLTKTRSHDCAPLERK